MLLASYEALFLMSVLVSVPVDRLFSPSLIAWSVLAINAPSRAVGGVLDAPLPISLAVSP